MTKFLALFLKILITLPVLAFLFFVTLSNRDQVLDLTWSPLNDPLSLSLPIILFAALIIGFVWGSLILWSNTFELRAERRAFKKQVSFLEHQLQLQRVELERRIHTKPVVDQAPAPTAQIPAPEIF